MLQLILWIARRFTPEGVILVTLPRDVYLISMRIADIKNDPRPDVITRYHMASLLER